MRRIVVASGGFDPVHSGHISYLSAARALGDQLLVGVNSDAWLIRKKGYAFLPVEERRIIVGNLKSVDATWEFDDADGSARSLLRTIRQQYPHAEIIFANGGDRTATNCLEDDVSGITFAFGVGGTHKLNSSSQIVNAVRKQQ